MHNWRLIILLLVASLAVSCRGGGEVPDAAPSVYYWRTTFQITPAQHQWIQQQGVRKLYLRLFDIVPSAHGPIPIATITFIDTLPPQLAVIPTIFIDYTLFRSPVDVDDLAQKTLDRIAKMAATHGFRYSEVQFDCDWTATTQQAYFDFLAAAQRADTGLILSSTIRLHQLSMPAPPCRYGALMLYNTGDFRQPDASRNPILDAEDVKPYLKYLARYPLPLCAAYPNFSWQLLFHDHQFMGMLYLEDLSDAQAYLPLDSTTYRVVIPRNVPIEKGRRYLHLAPGDTVRCFHSSPAQINQVRRMVGSMRKNIHDQTIIYHLSEIK